LDFAEFLELLNVDANVSFYLEYCSIQSSLPLMMADIGDGFEWADFLTLEMNNIWLGNGKTLGKLHFDPFDNLLCQIGKHHHHHHHHHHQGLNSMERLAIAGSKELTLYPPYKNEELYEGHIREAHLSFDRNTFAFSRSILTESTSMVRWVLLARERNPPSHC